MKHHNISSIKCLMNIFLAFTLGGIFIACQDELVIREDLDIPREDGISFICEDMIYANINSNGSYTRANGPKSEKEKKINTLHIFFFDQETGTLMKTTGYDNFTGYMKKENGFLKIPSTPENNSLFEGGDDRYVKIVAIANIDATDWADNAEDVYNSFLTEYSPTGKIAVASRDKSAEPKEITCYDDLKKWVYYPRLRIDESTGLGDIRELPKAGMPMIGELDSVKLNNKPDTPYIVNMESLMAKVYVTVELKPEQYIDELPEMSIEEIGVLNMPVAVPFKTPSGFRKGEDKLSRPADFDDYINNYDVTNVSMVHPGTTEHVDKSCQPEEHEYTSKLEQPIILNRKTGPEQLWYYTYENIQLPDYNAKGAKDREIFPNGGMEAQYPDSVKTDLQKQRWKSVMAYKNRASALILKGTYTTHQKVDYQAKFTVFMGGDAVKDFKVKRNHRYDNNITIYGLDYMRNSDDNVFNYDGRVDVVSDNPIYLAVVNERKIDAHASVLPVDIWLMMWEEANKEIEGDPNVDWYSEVTLSIAEPSKHKWIRMDRVVPRSEMEKSDWKAGTGARDYFTINLVQGSGNTKGELEDVISLTMNSEDHGSRSRVYFYIDENVPGSDNVNTSDPKSSNYYGDREATINVHYARYRKSDNTLVEDRDYSLDIRQRALVKISGKRLGRTDEYENVPDTWMEYYEEYLTHNDPLDSRTPTGDYYKTGLPWESKKTNFTDCTGHWSNEQRWKNSLGWRLVKCDDNEVYGCMGAIPMNAWIIDKLKGIEDIKLYNDEVPASAFHYAYGKNKRNQDGSVPDTDSKRDNGWYLPGIRELEAAMTQQYTNFEDFQGNFYWSAAPAEKSTHYPESNTNDYARATKVIVKEDGGIEYAESHPRHKTGLFNSQEVKAGPGHQKRDIKNRIRTFYRVKE